MRLLCTPPTYVLLILIAGYRSGTDCPFRIRANYSEKRGCAKVTTCNDVHTCDSTIGQLTNQDIKRAETSKLKFLLEAVPKHMTVDSNTPTRAIIDTVKQNYGQDIALRQAQKVKAILCPRSKPTCSHCGKPHAKNSPCGRDLTLQATSHGGAVMAESEDDSGMTFEFDINQTQLQDEIVVNNESLQTQGPTSSTSQSNHTLAFPHPLTGLGTVARNSHVSPMVDHRLAGDPRPRTAAQIRNQVRPQTSNDPSTAIVAGRLSASSADPHHTRTAQETRLEAARLMQNAARLMQEAARLNAEAARLTASVANI